MFIVISEWTLWKQGLCKTSLLINLAFINAKYKHWFESWLIVTEVWSYPLFTSYFWLKNHSSLFVFKWWSVVYQSWFWNLSLDILLCEWSAQIYQHKNVTYREDLFYYYTALCTITYSTAESTHYYEMVALVSILNNRRNCMKIHVEEKNTKLRTSATTLTISFPILLWRYLPSHLNTKRYVPHRNKWYPETNRKSKYLNIHLH